MSQVNGRYVGTAHPATRVETATVRLATNRGVTVGQIPRQNTGNRRPDPGDPVWCADETQRGGITRHRSDPVTVGDRARDGAVTAWVLQDDGRPPFVRVNAAHVTGIAADLTLDEAVALRNGLSKLLWRAGRD